MGITLETQFPDVVRAPSLPGRTRMSAWVAHSPVCLGYHQDSGLEARAPGMSPKAILNSAGAQRLPIPSYTGLSVAGS